MAEVDEDDELVNTKEEPLLDTRAPKVTVDLNFSLYDKDLSMSKHGTINELPSPSPTTAQVAKPKQTFMDKYFGARSIKRWVVSTRWALMRTTAES